jgi:hypothetical protein
MFATLIVTLPSIFEGGELVVHHAGKSLTIDLAQNSRHDFHYIAFFCNCEHEIKPIRSGYRLSLAYNLIQTGNAVLPVAPKASAQLDTALSLVSSWPKSLENIAFLLEHRYSPAELSFTKLHTADREVMELLQAVSSTFPLQIYIGISISFITACCC